MSWGQLDDQFHRNDKQLRMSDAAFRLYVCAISYCMDCVDPTGFLSRAQGLGFARSIGKGLKQIRELVQLNAWEEVDGGWLIHDFDQYVKRTSTERVRRFRERMRNGDETLHGGSGNGEETPRNRSSRAGGNPQSPSPFPVPHVSNAPPVRTAQPAEVRSDERPKKLPLSPWCEEVLVGYHEVTALAPTDTDRIAVCDFELEIGKYMPADVAVARMQQHVGWCDTHGHQRPRSVKGFWKTLRTEAEYRASNQAAARSGTRTNGMSSAGDVLANRSIGGTA